MYVCTCIDQVKLDVDFKFSTFYSSLTPYLSSIYSVAQVTGICISLESFVMAFSSTLLTIAHQSGFLTSNLSSFKFSIFFSSLTPGQDDNIYLSNIYSVAQITGIDISLESYILSSSDPGVYAGV